MSRTFFLLCVAGSALSFTAACADTEPDTDEMDEGSAVTDGSSRTEESTAPSADDAVRAVATIEPKSGTNLGGEAFFVAESEGDVSFGIYLENAPEGTHAVHIHESGDCSAPDASSAGDHWNPTNEEHGEWGDDPFHLGDIGNIEVDARGAASMSLTTDLWELENGERSVIGRAVVVHSNADDFTTQPDGAAGERIGCGVIEWKRGPAHSKDATTR